ncbi:MAG: SDR family oxidoreductase [Thermoleophilia bacterium]|nr:SDR family oxidoreductase [Thermoleophilia bacterium]
MEIHGSAVLVIGATGGFGAEVARELAARGARLALHGRDPARLEALGAELGAAALAADLRAPGAPARVVAWAAEALDGLDVVVNVAGVVAFGPVAELEEPVLRELVEVNLVAPALVARAAIPVLAEGGAIVNVSAIVAEQPTGGMAAYSAVKAGLSAFDAAMRRELRRAKVGVLDARPPHMETGLAARPIAGAAPRLATGRDPRHMAALLVDALAAGAPEVDWDA